MKTKAIEKKLTLNKATITNLTKVEMSDSRGGTIFTKAIVDTSCDSSPACCMTGTICI